MIWVLISVSLADQVYLTSVEPVLFTQMTLWCMAKSPLMFGGDVRKLDDTTYSLLTNPTLLEINSFSSNNKEVSKDELLGNNLIHYDSNLSKILLCCIYSFHTWNLKDFALGLQLEDKVWYDSLDFTNSSFYISLVYNFDVFPFGYCRRNICCFI